MATILKLTWVNTSINIGEQVIYRKLDDGTLTPHDSTPPDIRTYSEDLDQVDPYPYHAEYVVSSKTDFGEHGIVEKLSEPMVIPVPPSIPSVAKVTFMYGEGTDLPLDDLSAGLEYDVRIDCERPYPDYQPENLTIFINGSELIDYTNVVTTAEGTKKLIFNLSRIRVDIANQSPTGVYEISFRHNDVEFYSLPNVKFNKVAMVKFVTDSTTNVYTKSKVLFLDDFGRPLEDYYNLPTFTAGYRKIPVNAFPQYTAYVYDTDVFTLCGSGLIDITSLTGNIAVFPRFTVCGDPNNQTYQSRNLTGLITLASIPTWITSLQATFRFSGISGILFTVKNHITDLSETFTQCSNFDMDVGAWDVGNVTTLASTFAGTRFSGRGLETWDVSSVTSLSATFNGIIAGTDVSPYNLIGGWNVSNVTNMTLTFGNSTLNPAISNWDVSKVTTFTSTFLNNAAFNRDLSNWSTPAATNVVGMFRGAVNFNSPLTNFDVSNCTSLREMFYGCVLFNQPVNHFNVSKCTDLSGVFKGCSIFDQSVSSWDVSKVTEMSLVFSDCTAFNQPLDTWNVSSATTMSGMFWKASAFDQPIHMWNTANVTNMENMFYEALAYSQSLIRLCIPKILSLPANFSTGSPIPENDLPVWGTCYYAQNIPGAFTFIADVNNVTISQREVVTEYDTFVVRKNGVVLNIDEPYLPTEPNTVFAITPNASEITLAVYGMKEWVGYPTTSNITNITIGSPQLVEVPEKLPTYLTSLASLLAGSTILNSQRISNWDVSNITSISFLFNDCRAFNQPLNAWNTSKVTDMTRIFQSAVAFNQPLDAWNVSSATTMSGMFFNASTFNQPLDAWNTGNVTNMHSMFQSATRFNKPLNKWDTSKVTDLSEMFWSATTFNQDLSGWDVSNVTTMTSMFANATAFNKPIGNWNTSSVIYFDNMFIYASVFNQDISGWGVGNATSMMTMFYSAKAFNYDISSWCVAKINMTAEQTTAFYASSQLTADMIPIWGTCPFKGVVVGEDFIFETMGTSPIVISTSTNDIVTVRFEDSEVHVPVVDMSYFTTGMYLDNPIYEFTPGKRAYVRISPRDAVSTLTSLVYQDPAMISIRQWPKLGKWVKSIQLSFTDSYYIDSPNVSREAYVGERPYLTRIADLPSYITSTERMFQNITNVNIPVSKLTMTNVTNTSAMFMGCNAMTTSLDTWDVSNVIDASQMFSGCEAFTGQLRSWNTAKMVNTSEMFKNCKAITNTASNWNLSVVKYVDSMFEGCLNYAPADEMFSNSGTFITMSRMFKGCVKFNYSLVQWDTANVTTMEGMFEGCTLFNQDLSGWNTANVTNMINMFYNASAMSYNLTSWNVFNIPTRPTNFGDGSAITTAKEPIWGLSMGAETQLWIKLPATKDQTVSFLALIANRVDWGDGTVATLSGSTEQTVTKTYALSTVQDVIVKISVREVTELQFNFAYPEIQVVKWPEILSTKIALGPNVSTVPPDTHPNVKVMDGMFYGNTKLTQSLAHWDTSNVTSMVSMFELATVVPEGIGSWITSKVSSMSAMFRMVETFNQDISGWDTSKVTDMTSMFEGCASFNQPIGSWDVSLVENYSSMFEDAPAFNQPLGSWRTINATLMTNMFRNALLFNQYIQSWAVRNVTSMGSMFAGASTFNQPLVGWDVSSVFDFNSTFKNASSFSYDVSLWCTSPITTSIQSEDFATGSKLTPEQIPVWGTCPLGEVSDTTMVVRWDDGESSEVIAYLPDGTQVKSASGTSYTLSKGIQLGVGYSAYTFTPVINDIIHIILPAQNNGKYFEFNKRAPTELILWPKVDTGIARFILSDSYSSSGIQKVPSYLPSYVTTLSRMFSGATNFNDPNITKWDTSSVTNMMATFSNSVTFNQDISGWNTSNVTAMTNMFIAANAFNQPIGSWDVSKVTNMSSMFQSATSFNKPLADWDVSNVTTLAGMFNGATSFNQPLNKWVISKVTDLSYMFSAASRFNQPLNTWDTSSVTTTSCMFHNAVDFNQPLDRWNISKLTNISYMFSGTAKFNSNINTWDTSSVTNMTATFSNSVTFNQDISGWNTSNVTAMTNMFIAANAFNQPIGSWDVSKVTNMSSMFQSATSFNKPLADWDVSNVTKMFLMFGSAAKFNQSLSMWDVSNVTSMQYMFNNASEYSQPLNFWCVSKIDTAPVGFSGSSKLTAAQLPVWGTCPLNSMAANEMLVDWGVRSETTAIMPKGSVLTQLDGTVIPTTLIADLGMYIAEYTFNLTNTRYVRIKIETKPADGQSYLSIAPVRVYKWPTMTSGISYFNITGDQLVAVPKVSLPHPVYTYLFQGASNFNQDISGWDVSHVTRMGSMFQGCTEFNQPLNSWNVSKVQEMDFMFEGAIVFNQPLDNWNTVNVTNMRRMFKGATNFDQNIGPWDVSSVLYMTEMFRGCQISSSCDLSSWRTTNLAVATGCFRESGSVTGYGKWDITKLVSLRDMFRSKVTPIDDLSGWDTSKITDMSFMFYGCSNYNPARLPLDTRAVNVMEGMFQDAKKFNTDISSWNMLTVTNTRSMFKGASLFNQPLVNWKLATLVFADSMFKGAANYGQDLSRWCVTNILSEPTSFATDSLIPKAYLPVWGTCPFVPTFASNVLALQTKGGKKVTLVLSSADVVTVRSLVSDVDNPINTLPGYTQSTTEQLSTISFTPSNEMYIVIALSTASPSEDAVLVYDDENMVGIVKYPAAGTWIRSIQFSYNNSASVRQYFTKLPPLPSYLTSLNKMFQGVSGKIPDITNWDTQYINTMVDVFKDATSFNQNINGWDTVRVLDMQGMFQGASSFNSPIYSWSVNSVTNMDNMFYNAVAFNQDLSDWCVQNIYTVPAEFSTGSALISNFLPIWGTCPNKLDPEKIQDTLVLETRGGAPVTLSISPTDVVSFQEFGLDTVTPISEISGGIVTNTLVDGRKQYVFTPDRRMYIRVIPSSTSTATIQTVSYIDANTIGVVKWPTTKPWFNSIRFNGDTTGTRNYFTKMANIPAYITNVRWMFKGIISTLPDITKWNTSNITDMAYMFEGCINFNQNLNGWITTSLLDLSGTFKGCSSFNQLIGSWDVTIVRYLTDTFNGAVKFNQPLNSWVVDGAKAVDRMFQNATTFNQPLDKWRLASSSSADSMFDGASVFSQDISKWCVPFITSAPTGFSTGSQLTSEQLPVWGTCPYNGVMTNEVVIKTTGEEGVITIFSSTPIALRNLSTLEIYTPIEDTIFPDQTTIKRYHIPATTSSISVIWTAGVIRESTFSNNLIIQSFNIVKEIVTWPEYDFGLRTLEFPDCTMLTKVPSWLPSYLTNIQEMFRGCEILNQPIDTWDVSNIVNMRGMFQGCSSFNQPLNSWNTSNVTDMAHMFRYCNNFNGDITSWDIGKVNTTTRMFELCTEFNQPLNSWNTSNVTDMTSMFEGCASFNQPLYRWDVSNVQWFDRAFYAAEKYHQDLSRWCVSHIPEDSGQIFDGTLMPEEYLPVWGTCPIANLSVVSDSDIAYIGEDRTLTLIAETQGFNIETVTWESNKPNIVKITPDGVVTGMSTGEALIIATVNGRYVAYYTMIARIRKAVTPSTENIIEDKSVYRGANLYDLYTQVTGAEPKANAVIALVVPATVALVGDVANTAGLTIDSRCDIAKSITIINYGFISGIGATGQPTTTPAGIGIVNTSAKSVSVWNAGLVTGGGGGGGASYQSVAGGGGGAPFGAGGRANRPGTDATLFVPGTPGQATLFSAGGGGGIPGVAGENGDVKDTAGRATGAGATVGGLVTITNYQGGIRRGSDGTFTGADPLPEETSDIVV